jgi:DNA primase
MYREELANALDRIGVEYRLHSSNEDELEICCPFCTQQGETQDTRFRLGINLKKEAAYCFNCRWASVTGTLEKITSALGIEYIQRLDEAEREKRRGKTKKREIKLPDDFMVLKDGEEHWQQVAYNYVRDRGVANWQIEKHQIGFSVVGDFRYRIVFPVYYKEKLCGLVGRAFVEGLEPKYLNSIGDKVVYGLPERSNRTGIVLVEGAFDRLRIERAGVEYDVGALLGHSITDRQLEQLKPYDEVIFWPDPDRPGMMGFHKSAIRVRREGKRVRWVKTEASDRDPAEYELKEIPKSIDEAVWYTDTLFEKLRVNMAFREE